jgi:hypothetical protein
MSDFQPQEDDDAGGSFTPGKHGRLPYFKFFEDFEVLRRINDALELHAQSKGVEIPNNDNFQKGQSTTNLTERALIVAEVLGLDVTCWPVEFREMWDKVEAWLIVGQHPQSEDLITDLTFVVIRNADRWYRERAGKRNWEGLLRGHLNSHKRKIRRIDDPIRMGDTDAKMPDGRTESVGTSDAEELDGYLRQQLDPDERPLYDCNKQVPIELASESADKLPTRREVNVESALKMGWLSQADYTLYQRQCELIERLNAADKRVQIELRMIRAKLATAMKMGDSAAEMPKRRGEDASIVEAKDMHEHVRKQLNPDERRLYDCHKQVQIDLKSESESEAGAKQPTDREVNVKTAFQMGWLSQADYERHRSPQHIPGVDTAVDKFQVARSKMRKKLSIILRKQD